MDQAEREIIERLADYLEEAHIESGEMDADGEGRTHHGDGSGGCTYCEAIEDARTILASDDAAKAGR